MKLELTPNEVLTLLQALAFAGHYAQKERGKEFFDLYDKIDEQLKKPKVGVVGEILVKYMPLANNYIVDLLEREGAEAVVPDLIDFLNYSFYNNKFRHENYSECLST